MSLDSPLHNGKCFQYDVCVPRILLKLMIALKEEVTALSVSLHMQQRV
jgi:hypothetical protein